MIALAKSNPASAFSFSGYAVACSRPDCRVTIDMISASGRVLKSLKWDALKHSCDDSAMQDGIESLWWD